MYGRSYFLCPPVIASSTSVRHVLIFRLFLIRGPSTISYPKFLSAPPPSKMSIMFFLYQFFSCFFFCGPKLCCCVYIGYRLLKGVTYKSGPCASMIVSKADINRAGAGGTPGDGGEKPANPTPQAEAKVRANTSRNFCFVRQVFDLIFSGGKGEIPYVA